MRASSLIVLAATTLVLPAAAQLPLSFVENRGVYPAPVSYYVRGSDKTLFFTQAGVTFSLRNRQRSWVVKLEFMDAASVRPRGEDRRQAVYSYFVGKPADWKTGLPTFSQVVYENLWPGIDLVYRGTVHKLKYEFRVKPGANPRRVKLRYRGARRVSKTAAGGLRVETPVSSFEDGVPIAYQQVDGTRVPVKVAFDLADDSGEFGFRVGRYDPTKTLVLDPTILVYSGFLGGRSVDYGRDLAVHPSGEAYLTGYTYSDQTLGFPVKVGPALLHAGQQDAFVAKVNAQGTALVYCGYIGGGGSDQGFGIAVDAAGSAYVTGLTNSDVTSFPVTVGPDLRFNGRVDGFVAKVNIKGTGLDYCGYIGGALNESGEGIAVDAKGNAYVTGYTQSDQNSFPVKVGPDLTFNGGGLYGDVFVARVNAKGTALDYCGYIGGSSDDRGYDIAVTAAGNAYVTGSVRSNQQTFPVKLGPDLTYNGGTYDAFVAKVNLKGNALDYCGYVGGSGSELGQAIAVNAAGNAFVVGNTYSSATSFPVKTGPFLTQSGSSDGFVARVNISGLILDYCGYIGGSRPDFAFGIAVDTLNDVYLTGITQSTNFPVKLGPDLTYNGGIYDAFVAKLKADGKSWVFAGYVGGSGSDYGRGIGVDTSRNVYVGGETQSLQGFPTKIGPDLTHNGSSDAFVTKVALNLIESDKTSAKIGTTVNFTLTATDDVGLVYQVASSFGQGPTPIDSRQIGLSVDNLLLASVGLLGPLPQLFTAYSGTIDKQGGGKAALNLPVLVGLVGLKIHTAFVTFEAKAPSGVKSISNAVTVAIGR